VAVGDRKAGSVCAWAFEIRLGGEAIKHSSLLAQYTVTRHTWPDWMRSLLINLEQLVAYLDFEHTLDAWYRHTSSTNSGRPGTILSSTIDHLQGIHHPRNVVATGNRLAIGGSLYMVAGADICVFASYSISSRFRSSVLKTHVRLSFVPRVGAREDWQRMRPVRVRSGANGRSGER